MVAQHVVMKGVAAALAVLALCGAIFAVRRALRQRPDEELTAATATNLSTQVTPMRNRVDILGATGAITVWTPREAYFIEGQTIPIVYDRRGNVRAAPNGP